MQTNEVRYKIQVKLSQIRLAEVLWKVGKLKKIEGKMPLWLEVKGETVSLWPRAWGYNGKMDGFNLFGVNGCSFSDKRKIVDMIHEGKDWPEPTNVDYVIIDDINFLTDGENNSTTT